MKKYLLSLLVTIVTTFSFAQQQPMKTTSDSAWTSTDTTLVINNQMSVASESPVKEEPPYKLNLPVDIPLTVVTCATTVYGFSKIYNKDRLTLAEVNSLDPQNVNRFDRSATHQFDENFTKVGDYLFYSSMPLPLFLLIDKRMRKDFPRIITLYLETMGVTGVIYVSAVHFGDRYRPYAYNPEAPIDFRTRGGARNSFFAGHPSLVATSTFFMASMITHYHPESRVKWLYYTIAGAMTATTALARYKGGRHFPSDLIVGVSIGTLSGLLVPKIHENRDLKKRKTAFMPFFGQSSGIAVVHKF